jgi:molybdenum cofactor synthesis domain-containing protein
MRCGILTVSDRSARGKRPDGTGPILEALLRENGWEVAATAIVPDEPAEIRAVLVKWADEAHLDLILTNGGTGFAPRDVTPEATLEVVDRLAPGLAESMRAASLKVTPHGMLSRAVSGIRKRTLIINLPGSPKGARENLEVVLPVIPHAVQLLREAPDAESRHTELDR